MNRVSALIIADFIPEPGGLTLVECSMRPTPSKRNGEGEAHSLAATAFWRRLDTSGSDVARLFQTASGWRLEGTAVFLQNKEPARLDYALDLGADWTTQRGIVRGFVGETAVDETIVRDAAGWSMNGTRMTGLQHLKDLDLGFTPATNLPQIRRVNLSLGEAVDFAVAWWEPGAATLVDLPQHYRRRDERTYWYESPTGPYQEELEFAPSGFIRSYPRLWVLESD